MREKPLQVRIFFFFSSGDHALIDLGCIGHFNPKVVTVRSKSRDVLSVDSTPVSLHSKQHKKMIKQVSSNLQSTSDNWAPSGPDRTCPI